LKACFNPAYTRRWYCSFPSVGRSSQNIGCYRRYTLICSRMWQCNISKQKLKKS